jgi:hypothetical protein
MTTHRKTLVTWVDHHDAGDLVGWRSASTGALILNDAPLPAVKFLSEYRTKWPPECLSELVRRAM